MKRKLLTLMLTAAIVGIIPVSAYASSSMDKSGNNQEIVTSHEIITEVDENGTESQVGLVTYEQQPDEASLTKAGCSSGKHLNVVNNGAPDTTRIHGKVHPGYCTVKTTTYWRCTACNTTGHDDKYSLVWCPSSNISGDEGEEGPGLE